MFRIFFPQNEAAQSSLKQDVIVIFGCACCLVQSALSLILLITQWIRHPTCILYLKIQLCSAIVSQMCMFLYAAKNVSESNFSLSYKLLTLRFLKKLKRNRVEYANAFCSFFFSERLRILFAVLANSDHRRNNVALEPTAHCLHGNNQFPTIFQYQTTHYRRSDRWVKFISQLHAGYVFFHFYYNCTHLQSRIIKTRTNDVSSIIIVPF